MLPNLGYVDYCVLMMAITFKENRIMRDRPYFATDCAREGYLDLVIWSHDHNNDTRVTEETFFYAVKSGNVELVKWLSNHYCDIHENILAYAKDFKVVKFLINIGEEVDSEFVAKKLGANCDSKTLEWLMFSAAARQYTNVIIKAAKKAGNTEFMNWCKEHNFPRHCNN